MSYDLTRLKSEGFEHLVQSLALSTIGPGVRVFGAGPDGGREATFRGTAEISGDGTWDGYCVIQAKYKARITDTPTDQRWFLSELTKELDAWVGRGRKKPRANPPKYLIFATNVTLTAVQQSGGLDRVDQLITKYRDMTDDSIPGEKIGLPGLESWAIWHPEQLHRMLDINESVRTKFADFILPGDVLSRLYKQVKEDDNRLVHTWIGHTTRALKADLSVELGESGDLANSKLRLEDIAVDLPVTFGSSNGTKRQHALLELIRRGDMVLAPEFRPIERDRIIVLGGPGSGKSTISRLLCQIYRASILQGDSALMLTQSDAAIAERLREAFADADLPVPGFHRLPIRVVLSTFADALSQRGNLTLLQHIMALVNSRQSDQIDIAGMKRLISSWPLILVLDGLDEVASAENRSEVLTRIDEFSIEMATWRADVLTICTSRPTGYSHDEYSNYEIMQLNPLDTDEALGYAKRLLGSSLANDEDRQEIVLGRLNVAARNSETARLMTSPLQVTILTLLLERRSHAPASRYGLFKAYYDTIYAREQDKIGLNAEVLERFRSQLDRIHELAGLEIHRRSEKSGDAEAILDEQDLVKIVRGILLDDDGYSKSDAEELVTQILSLAKERLVLLVPRSHGVAFEVRSLAEFFAARCLMASAAPEEELERLIPSAHWRHTWLLAAGYVFSDFLRMRDTVVHRINSIDVINYANRLVMPGALLAVDALKDGFSAGAPRFEKDLARSALRLLDGPTGDHITALAEDFAQIMEKNPRLEELTWDELERRLRTSNSGAARAFLIFLASAPVDNVAHQANRRIEKYESPEGSLTENSNPPAAGIFEGAVMDRLDKEVEINLDRMDDASEFSIFILDQLGRSLGGSDEDKKIILIREAVARTVEEHPASAPKLRKILAIAMLRDQIGHLITPAGMDKPSR